MIDRRRLRRAVMRRLARADDWFLDRYERWPGPLRAAYEHVDEHVAARALCALAGHEPEPDQCLLPEHDYCLWCHSSLPFQAANVPDRLLRRLHARLEDPAMSAKIDAKLGPHGLNLRGRAHG